MRTQLRTSRVGTRILPFNLTGSGTTVSGNLSGSGISATLASSIFTVTPKWGFRTPPFIFGATTIATPGGYVLGSSPANSTFGVSTFNAAGSATDAVIHALAVGWDTTETLGSRASYDISCPMPMLVDVFKVQGTGTAAVTIGGLRASLVDNGTGNYTLTFNDPAHNPSTTYIPNVVGTTCAVACVAPSGNNALNVRTYNSSGTLVDADFYLYCFKRENITLYGDLRIPLETSQNRGRVHFYRITVTGGVPALTHAPYGTTITDNGVGDFTVTYPPGSAFAREAIVMTGGGLKTQAHSSSTTSFRVLNFNAAGSATDPATMDALVLGFDDVSQFR